MRYLLIFLFGFAMLIGIADAQPGFNLNYDFGSPLSRFTGLAYSNDTLILHGTVDVPDSARTAMVLMFMDTSGQVLNTKFHFDSLGRSYDIGWDFDLLNIEDGSGYLVTGTTREDDNGMVIKYDRAGNVVWTRDYEDAGSRQDVFSKIMEVSDGFLIGGYKIFSDGSRDYGILMKIDYDGNKLWEKSYPDPDPARFGRITSLSKKDENTFIVGGRRYLWLATHPPDRNYQSWVFAIDNQGNTIWEWKSEKGTEESGVYGSVIQLPKGNWGYMTTESHYVSPPNRWFFRPKFVVRDSGLNLVRQRTFGPLDTYSRYLSIKKLSDGGLIGVGMSRWDADDGPYTAPYPSLEYFPFSGWTVKMDELGNPVWQRADTVSWAENGQNELDMRGSFSWLRDVVELPGGSIISCGNGSVFIQQQEHSKSWVIKVSKDGCLDTLYCGALVDTEEAPLPEAAIQLQAYPNPSSGPVRFRYQLPPGSRRALLRIVDISGRELWQQAVPGPEGELQWPAEVPPGLYFYQLLAEGRPLRAGKVVLR